MDRLKGKVALISGAARGQGAAETKLFVNESARVVIGDVLDSEAGKLASEINQNAGARVTLPVHLDVTRAEDWRAAVETCEREFGGLDILVNNAGILNIKGVSDTNEEEWERCHQCESEGRMVGDQDSGSRHEKARRRIHHQHLVHLRPYRFGRVGRISCE
jgi:3alpha(or 20beta)-hydroxysteroid dehydrogenase